MESNTNTSKNTATNSKKCTDNTSTSIDPSARIYQEKDFNEADFHEYLDDQGYKNRHLYNIRNGFKHLINAFVFNELINVFFVALSRAEERVYFSFCRLSLIHI